MRISLLLMVAAAVLLLGGCGGGMNSSNSDAPKADEAHEVVWVANHRDAILNFANYTTKNINGETVVDGVMLNEAANQCRVCHGPTLAGPREGYGGPDCLSCHVLDPVKYPVMCYSCHGGWAIVPFNSYTTGGQNSPIVLSLKQNGWPVSPLQKWFSTARAQRGDIPYDPTFVSRVKSGTSIHRKHTAIGSFQYDSTLNINRLVSTNECTVCHGNLLYGTTLGEGRHHVSRDIKVKRVSASGVTPAIWNVVFPEQQASEQNLVSIHLVWHDSCFGTLDPNSASIGCHSAIKDPVTGGFSLTMDCVACHGKPH